MVESVVIPASGGENPSLEQEAATQEAANQPKAEPKLAGEEGTPERPEWLPEKFKTVEDMAKAYSELEKSMSKGEKPTEAQQEAATEAVENAGLDMEALSAEYATNGELSQESYDALAKVGITQDMVEAYIAGQEAQASAIQADLLEPLGGDMEAYSEVTAWAADNLSDKEIENFNTVLDSGNTAAIKMAVQNLANKYTAANGVEPARQLTGKASGNTTGVYESTADLMKDMQNPEYENNPAFRAKVEAKLARSNIL
jgi:hypothetical protein